jgi:hypothetical protein
MTEKVFITEQDKATIICPECKLSTTTDASQYKKINKEVRLKINCTCGHSYSILLERRNQFRRETNLPGKYILRSSSGTEKMGSLTVKNISRGGLKLELKLMPNLKLGSRLSVEFNLDDNHKTLIKKDVIVKGIIDPVVGAEFSSFDTSDPGDKALGFYLFA